MSVNLGDNEVSIAIASDKTGEITGVPAIRETVDFILSNIASSTAPNLVALITKNQENCGSVQDFSAVDATSVKGTLNLNTEEFIQYFSGDIGYKVPFSVTVQDIVQDNNLLVDTIKVLNNPYSSSYDDPTEASAIGANVFTDAMKAKLAGVEESADVTDATNVDSAGAVMESDYTPAYSMLFADVPGATQVLELAQNSFVGRKTSGIVNIQSSEVVTMLGVDDKQDKDYTALTEKSNVSSSDIVAINDSEASFGIKKLSFANIWTWIKNQADSLYGAIADVASNTAHSSGDGSDHADVATNTVHSSGDGSDHANVALNDAHRVSTTNPHSVDLSQLNDVDLTLNAQGDILYNNGTAWVNLGAGTTGQFLKTLGAGANPAWGTPAGSGDVSGSVSSTDNAIVRWNGVGGDTIQDSGILIDDSDNITGINNVTGSDVNLVTGTAGASGKLAGWNIDGDLVDSNVSSSSVTDNTTHSTGDGSDHSDVALNTTHRASTSNPHSVVLNQIPVDEIGTATYNDLKDFLDITASAGYIDGGTITDAGAGAIDVTAGVGMIKTSNSATAPVKFFDWAQSLALALTDNSENYIYVDYNAGSPVVGASATNLSNGRSIFNIGRVYREGTTLHILDAGQSIIDQYYRILQRTVAVEGMVTRADGAVTSETGIRSIALSAGVLYANFEKVILGDFDSNAGDTFNTYHRASPSGWTSTTGQTQINNTQYDDGDGTLGTLTVNQYGIHWVYLHHDGDVSVIYGQDSYTLSEAQQAQPPASIPSLLKDFAILSAKIIIERDATAFTDVESAFDKTFNPSTATDHGDLAGTSDASSHPASAISTVTTNFNNNLSSSETTVQKALEVLDDLSTGASLSALSDVTLTSVAQGDILYRNGTNWVNLGAGTTGQFLKTLGAGANPAWGTPAVYDGDITSLDIDGGTDIGADLVDADLIIVDDGAGGTNRKSAFSRIWTYIKNKIVSTFWTGWYEISSSKYTATPSSTSTIAMSDTSDFKVNQAIKYTDGRGTYFAKVASITTNTSISIEGGALSVASDLTALYAGDGSKTVQLDVVVNGLYAEATGDKLASVAKTYFKWGTEKAHLVSFSGTQNTADGTTQPKVNVKIAGSAVSTNDTNNGIQISATPGTWVDNSAVAINTANYDINDGEAIEINVTGAGGDGAASDLTMTLIFVKE